SASPPEPRRSGLPRHLERRRRLSWRGGLLEVLPVTRVLAYVIPAPPIWVFVPACLGVLPLAGYMGEATEHLAHRTSPTIGGAIKPTLRHPGQLINATVGLRGGLG